MHPVKDYALIAGWLTGQVCINADMTGTPLTINFLNASFFITEPWRFTIEDRIAGSSSMEAEQRALLALVAGARLMQVVITPPWHDLKLVFSNGVNVEVFQDSDRYENWNLSLLHDAGKEQHLFIAGTQTEWTAFDSLPDSE
jgi:hypothetical protein